MRLWASLPVWGFNQPQPLLVWHLGRLPHIPQQRATAPKSWNHLILNPWFECLVLRVRETKAEQHKPLTAAFPQPTLPLGKSHDWSQKIHTLNHRQMHCTQTHSHHLSLSLSLSLTHTHTCTHIQPQHKLMQEEVSELLQEPLTYTLQNGRTHTPLSLAHEIYFGTHFLIKGEPNRRSKLAWKYRICANISIYRLHLAISTHSCVYATFKTLIVN